MMKRYTGFLFFCFWAAAAGPTLSAAPAGPSFKTAGMFLENRGQTNRDVLYYTRRKPASLAILQDGALGYSLEKQSGRRVDFMEHFSPTYTPVITGLDTAQTLFHFFDGKQSTSCVRAFSRVVLSHVYPAINVALAASTLEKVFTLLPGADPADIHIEVTGADQLAVGDDGQLLILIGADTVHFTPPVAWQIDGRVDIAYDVRGTAYGFTLGNYNPDVPVYIDPLLASTFLGGGAPDACLAMAVSDDDKVYVAGQTESANFPATPGVFDTDQNARQDAFVACFDQNLKTLHACSYFGGDGPCYANNISFDSNGDIYIGGNITRYNMDKDFRFPATPDAYCEQHQGGQDVFIAKFKPGLGTLTACTFVGGSQYDSLAGLEYDKVTNQMYLSGITWGQIDDELNGDFVAFPTTPGAYDQELAVKNNHFGDVFVSCLDTGLSTLTASTYLGGIELEQGGIMSIDTFVVVTGTTFSDDFPAGQFSEDKTYDGLGDGFVTVFYPDLSQFGSSTFIGGSGFDDVRNVVLKSRGDIYVHGETDSPDFPTTPGVYQETFTANSQFFLTRLNRWGHLIQSTFYGALDQNRCARAVMFHGDIIVMPDLSVYVANTTCTSSFPVTVDCFDGLFAGDSEAFIAKFSPDLSDMEISTFIGGQKDDWLYALECGPDQRIYAAGTTSSSDFITTGGAFDVSFNGPAYGFLWQGDGIVFALDKHLSQGVIPVELSAFNAAVHNGTVRLSWTTESETESCGFRLYRSVQTPSGPFERINSRLVPSAGHSSGQKHYVYDDGDVHAGLTYYYRLEQVDNDGKTQTFGPVSAHVPATPERYALYQNYPNPFNRQTTINFDLPAATRTKLEILNVKGETVRTLVDAQKAAGAYHISWDGRSDNGHPTPSGTYIYILETGGFADFKSLVLMR